MESLIFQDVESSKLGRVGLAMRNRKRRGVHARRIDCYALVISLSGPCRFRAEGLDPVDVAPGDAFLLFPGVAHSYGPSKGELWEELYILFEGPVFDLWMSSGLLDPSAPLYSLHPLPMWEGIMLGLRDEVKPLARVLRMQHLLARMQQNRMEQAVPDLDALWLEEARSRLRSHLEDVQPVHRVARELGLGYQTFRKKFSRLQGEGPARFVAQRQMERAARRLLSDNVSVREIAEEFGFSDEFHFSRRFKQMVGVSPSVYRKRASG